MEPIYILVKDETDLQEYSGYFISFADAEIAASQNSEHKRYTVKVLYPNRGC